MPRPISYAPPKQVQVLAPQQAFSDVEMKELLQLPSTLYCAGDTTLLTQGLRVAVVGSRSASPDGLRRASKLATQLAKRGVIVVSGLAAGIDITAHRACMAAGGRTIAVIGTSLHQVYPKEHAQDQMNIYREHLLISQFDPNVKTYPSSFLARNKVMARIAHASVIVEAGDKSGSISHGRDAMKMGRPLFIMRNMTANSSVNWPRKYINSGAHILDSTDQLIKHLMAA